MHEKIEKIYQKYLGLSAPVRASLWFVICRLFQKSISIISAPLFTRILTTEQYGMYSVYQSWYSLFAIFATLNLYAGVYKNGLAKHPDDRERFTSSMLGLSTTITILLFFCYLINVEYWNKALGMSTFFVLALFVEVLFVPAYDFWSAAQHFDYQYKKFVWAVAYVGIASPLLGVIFVLSTEYKAEARVAAYVLVQVCLGLIFYIQIMRKGKTFYNKKYWKMALSFSLPLIPHYLSRQILNQSDRIMISRMIGNSEAAIYSVAYTVGMLMNIVTNAINDSFVPFTYKALKKKDYKAIGKSANALVVLVGCLTMLTIVLGPEIIKILAAPNYHNAIWVIPPVAVSVYFTFLYPLFGNIEFYFEKTKFVMIASSVGAALNIILNYIFIPIYGYYAAGYTTLICYMLFVVVHYIFHKKVLRDEVGDVRIYDMRFIVNFSLMELLLMIIMTILYNYTVLRYFVLIVMLIVMVIMRKQIFSIIQTIRSKK